MPRFFTDNINDNIAVISGDDARHIIKSLRTAVGEELIICDCKGNDFLCRVKEISDKEVFLEIKEKTDSIAEPAVKLTLFQALPKGEKMELIIQKCIELGVDRIVPVITERTISRPDEKSRSKKVERWQKIALEAAKQSGRGIIPKIEEIHTFKDATEKFMKSDRSIIFYENGGESIKNILSGDEKSISVMIGSEGGFSESEVDFLKNCGADVATLGKRILRCETAPIAVTSIIMFEMGEMN